MSQEEEEVKNADTLHLVHTIFHYWENIGPDKFVWPESIAQCFFPYGVFLLVYFLLIITFQNFFSWNQWDDKEEEDDQEEVNGGDIASNNPVREAERCEDLISDLTKYTAVFYIDQELEYHTQKEGSLQLLKVVV